MEYNEIIQVLSKNPQKNLLNKYIKETEGLILHYKSEFSKSKDNYYKGKIGMESRKLKYLKRKLSEIGAGNET